MEGGGMRGNDFAYRSSSAAGGDSGNAEAAEGDDGIELSLGPSTNGRFGLDPSTERFRRSSSVSDLHTSGFSYENGVSYSGSGSGAPLLRASSVPTEIDESRRSMEARRPRMERIRVSRGLRIGESSPDVNR